jgi:hypothetical protein
LLSGVVSKTMTLLQVIKSDCLPPEAAFGSKYIFSCAIHLKEQKRLMQKNNKPAFSLGNIQDIIYMRQLDGINS